MAAAGNFVLDKGYDAAVQLTKYRFVKFSADETVTPITAKTDVVAGVPQFDVLTAEITRGKGASIRVIGETEIEVSAAVAAGQLAGLNADGTVHVAATGDRVVGTFTKGAAGAGNRATLLISQSNSIAP